MHKGFAIHFFQLLGYILLKVFEFQKNLLYLLFESHLFLAELFKFRFRKPSFFNHGLQFFNRHRLSVNERHHLRPLEHTYLNINDGKALFFNFLVQRLKETARLAFIGFANFFLHVDIILAFEQQRNFFFQRLHQTFDIFFKNRSFTTFQAD